MEVAAARARSRAPEEPGRTFPPRARQARPRPAAPAATGRQAARPEEPAADPALLARTPPTALAARQEPQSTATATSPLPLGRVTFAARRSTDFPRHDETNRWRH